MSLLSVADLSVTFDTDRGPLRAVDGVDLTVERGETLCLVGESGSGKTVACESLTGLLPASADVSGRAEFDGQDLLAMSEQNLRSVRGDRIAYVFQNPQGALDPVYTVGEQVVEAIRIHRDVSRSMARRRALDLLSRVGIPDPDQRFDEYPHEFSGGMKQRVVIATALAADPDLLVCDEPTTALDVTIQARILSLLDDIQAERDTSILFVTHNLGVVAQVADRVGVMYAGELMERGTVHDVFADPGHPYTEALLDSLPRHDRPPRPIDGSFPDATDLPDGCRFHPRCPYAVADCREGDQPALVDVGGGRDGSGPPATDDPDSTAHRAACVFHHDGYDAAALDEGVDADD